MIPKKHENIGVLFDGAYGYAANCDRIQHLAIEYGWPFDHYIGPDFAEFEDSNEQDFNKATEDAIAYLNKYAVADGYMVEWHEGDFIISLIDSNENHEELEDAQKRLWAKQQEKLIDPT